MSKKGFITFQSIRYGFVLGYFVQFTAFDGQKNRFAVIIKAKPHNDCCAVAPPDFCQTIPIEEQE